MNSDGGQGTVGVSLHILYPHNNKVGVFLSPFEDTGTQRAPLTSPDHTANKQRTQDLNPDVSDPKAHGLPIRSTGKKFPIAKK